MALFNIPYTFVAQTKAKASEINANFQALKTLIETTKFDQANLANDSVGAAQIIADSVGASEVAPDSLTLAEINDTAIHSGTYSPTVTNNYNAEGVALVGTWRYIRVGTIVSVSGVASFDPGFAGESSFYVTLPIASAFTTQNDLSGLVIGAINSNGTGIAVADATGDRAKTVIQCPDSTSVNFKVAFAYEVK